MPVKANLNGTSCAFLHNTALLGGVMLLCFLCVFTPLFILFSFFDLLAYFVGRLLPSLSAMPTHSYILMSDLNEIAYWVFTLVMGLAALAWTKQALTPRKAQLRRLAGGRLMKIPSDNAISEYVEQLCLKHAIRRPAILAAPSENIAAFVFAPPLRKPQLVLSQGVLRLPPDLLRWIIAHEIGHLVHRDAKHIYAWWCFLDSLTMLHRLRFRILARIANVLRFIPLLGRPSMRVAIGIERLFQRTFSAGMKVAGAWYEVMSRWASRRIEFRADAFAAAHEGVEPGVTLFRSLASEASFEPMPFKVLVRTHPTHQDRVKALYRLSFRE
ncbi:M48 family metallopeptidase [Vreelandella massiliensis]|uniref:M48 family metallopeptidase n=1 Tax=Vreelandella massiliensis TaxID=1816686 RepID=UPI0009FA302F|nr:M48 family metalloprotease [Halomonas massiliensis]